MATIESIYDQIAAALEHDTVRAGVRAAVILLVAFVVARIVRRRLRGGGMRAQHRLLARRIISGVIYGIAFAWALSELGLNMGVLLGAAGVLTVAVGFAAQTSVSNLISGLFLMVERPFQIEDIIKVGSTTGVVLAIDLMSTKLRTFDNLYVRIPNETLLKAEVTNLTHFPIRRYDLLVGVAYKEDIAAVREILFEVADRNPLCLAEPEPILIFLGFGESSLDLQLSVWATKDNFLALRNTMHEEIKRAFDARGIEIPFPHRTLYSGSETAAMPVRIVGTEK